jgi:hypothetical protein
MFSVFLAWRKKEGWKIFGQIGKLLRLKIRGLDKHFETSLNQSNPPSSIHHFARKIAISLINI